jgi:hypothetical protein
MKRDSKSFFNPSQKSSRAWRAVAASCSASDFLFGGAPAMSEVNTRPSAGAGCGRTLGSWMRDFIIEILSRIMKSGSSPSTNLYNSSSASSVSFGGCSLLLLVMGDLRLSYCHTNLSELPDYSQVEVDKILEMVCSYIQRFVSLSICNDVFLHCTNDYSAGIDSTTIFRQLLFCIASFRIACHRDTPGFHFNPTLFFIAAVLAEQGFRLVFSPKTWL